MFFFINALNGKDNNTFKIQASGCSNNYRNFEVVMSVNDISRYLQQL
jgi:hypothetical protein